MRRALSGLTTRGRCLLAAGLAALICSLLLDERDLLRLAVFALSLPLLAALVASNAKVGLRASREVVTPRATAGSSTAVRLEVHSSGRLGSGLLIEDEVPGELGGRPRFVVGRLPRRDPVRLHYRLVPRRRGVYPLGPLVARITDPFGLAEYERELGERTRFVVTPAVAVLTGMPEGDGRAGGADGAGRLRSGAGTDAVVVRGYQRGDDLRKVHWRSTARHDELMVRVEEQPWNGGTTVLLDHRAPAHRGAGADSSLEYAVSLAASAYLHLHRHGRQVELVTADGRGLPGGRRPVADTDAVLDALAELRASAHRELQHAAALEVASELVAVLGATSPADVEQLCRHRPRGLRSRAVLLDTGAWPARYGGEAGADPAEAAELLGAAGWSVVVAAPDDPVPVVWERLCTVSLDRPVAPR